MPDAILLDGQLPAPGGIEFLRGLRREPGGVQPLVVLVTTDNDVPRISEAMGAGASDYMLKPFDGPSLEQKFRQIGYVGFWPGSLQLFSASSDRFHPG